MNISFSVAYNERRLRRVITFLVRRQLKWLRVMGVVAAVAGVAALATEFLSDSTGTFSSPWA
ncbi:hypothetical protein [Streptomyces scabiei]|uniref:hypothetical protein n=1 Tax=Streptomyces scabiei TaxID=1930 RepID=UPI00076618BB|nr:hypothetical protein [Streptomyces scabiei]